MSDKLPADEIIERAAELWVRAIRVGGWDNGDRSSAGPMSQGLALMVRDSVRRKLTEPFEDVLTRFKTKFIECAKARAEGYFNPFLGTDYGPDKYLAEVCEAAGLDSTLLPVKSTTYTDETYVSESFGYGAPTKYHYPLGGGRWLITSLRGDEDMNIVINAVREGHLRGLEIE